MEPLTSADPQQIGDFRLLSVLGEGGFGRVYLGLSPHGRLVAVKLIDLKFAQDPGFRERFKREIKAIQAVRGDYTASVVAAGPDAVRPWFAMKYVPGPSLHRIVEETGPLPAITLWWIAAQVAEALTSIHAARLLHRDLKPANILVSRHGLRVLDFGISRAIDRTRITSSSITMGTWGFMPLEQVEDPHHVDTPADVFAFGATLAFAGTGHPPYSGTYSQYVYQLIAKAPDLSGLPDELTEVVTACLARDQAHRPTPGAVLAKAAVHLDRVDSDDVSALLPGSVMALIDAEESAASSIRSPAINRPATRAFIRSSPSTGSLKPAQPRRTAAPVAAGVPRKSRSPRPWFVGVWLFVAVVTLTAAALALGARQVDVLSHPAGLVLDAHGNLFIADSSNNRVRKASTDGKITTVAGSGNEGFSGDGGPATKALLSRPAGVAVDAKGNLFIADSGNNRVRKVATNRTITTIVG